LQKRRDAGRYFLGRREEVAALEPVSFSRQLSLNQH